MYRKEYFFAEVNFVTASLFSYSLPIVKCFAFVCYLFLRNVRHSYFSLLARSNIRRNFSSHHEKMDELIQLWKISCMVFCGSIRPRFRKEGCEI